MRFNGLVSALLSVGVPVSRYFASKKRDKYIVWAEDGQANSLHADGRVVARSIQGTVDYYTKTEDDPVAERIELALNGTDISWRLNSVQHEEDTGFIHFEWVFEVEQWQE